MDQQIILVIGATGTAGTPVARQLREDGYHVRLLVRDPAKARDQLGSGFEYIQGSVEERETVKQALSGCTGVHISLQAGSNPADIERVEHLGTLRVIELAAQQPLAHLTYVSGMFVGAEVGSAVLQEPEAANKIFYIQGPEALTMREALQMYCSILELKARVTTIPLRVMFVVDTLFLGKKMRRTLQIMQVIQRFGEVGDPKDANRILGAPTTTLRAWCEQQRLHRSREANASREEKHSSASKEAES